VTGKFLVFSGADGYNKVVAEKDKINFNFVIAFQVVVIVLLKVVPEIYF
jgi:hypothetical protein